MFGKQGYASLAPCPESLFGASSSNVFVVGDLAHRPYSCQRPRRLIFSALWGVQGRPSGKRHTQAGIKTDGRKDREGEIKETENAQPRIPVLHTAYSPMNPLPTGTTRPQLGRLSTCVPFSSLPSQQHFPAHLRPLPANALWHDRSFRCTFFPKNTGLLLPAHGRLHRRAHRRMMMMKR